VFSDPRLRSAQPALGPLGLPKVASGNYCSVYELRSGGGRWAVRCFNRQVPDAKRRYRTIDEHLNRHPLPWLVGFDFLDEGIRIRGRWYPIVVMDWVEGVTLSRYLEQRVRDGTAVRALADQWPQMMTDLRSAGIAHGDLQHGNILVSQETFRLVDYDNLYVPAFQGELSPELGRLHYQHPGRTADDFDLEIANFSALVIYLSLRALAVDSALWRYYNGENLVLTADDYRRPAASPALAQMRASPDSEVGRLAQELARCAALPVAQVPPLETVLTAAGITVPRGPAVRPPPRPASQRPDWLDGPAPGPTRSRPASQRRPSAPAPSGGSWWEEVETPPSPPPAPSTRRTPPRSRQTRRPDWMASRRQPAPGGAIALPRRSPVPGLGVGGCVAVLVRSCLVMLFFVMLILAGAAWWAYLNWEQIAPTLGLPPISTPQGGREWPFDPRIERPDADRPGRRTPAPERLPPHTVPRPSPSPPEARPAEPPGPPARAEPQRSPTRAQEAGGSRPQPSPE
jgi:hypothetical protein